jgi:glycosyltransferase involved in cell wall biosynthesis
MKRSSEPVRPTLLIVGAFPPSESAIVGGIVTACRLLIESTFASRFNLVLIDSTQVSNPPPAFLTRLLFALRRNARYVLKLHRSQPDAVLLFTSVGASVIDKGAMAWLARLWSVPVLMFPRGAEIIGDAESSRFQHFWIKLALRGATHFLCQGPRWQRFATGMLGFPIERAPIVFNWTASNRLLELGRLRTDFGDGREVRLLFLGWLEPDKGIFDLLDSCNSLRNRCSFKLILAGRGNGEKLAREYVRLNEMEADVSFVGWTTGEEKESLLASADILVLPSWNEGFPNAVIEAMCTKTTVIVSEVGAIPGILNSEEHVLFVPPKEPKALAEAIARLVQDRAFRITLAENAYIFASSNFAVEPGVERLATEIFCAIERDKSPAQVERNR